MKLHASFFVLLATVLLNTFAQAQVACFTIDHPKGCAPHTVNVTDCSTGGSPGNINYNYTGTGGYIPTTTHTYNASGSFVVKQLVINTSAVPVSQDQFSLPVTVINAVQPTVTVKKCSGRRVDVIVTDNTYDLYDISFGEGVGDVSNASPNTTYTHTYASTATFNIAILGKFTSGNTCAASTKIISVTPVSTLSKPDITFLEVTQEGVSNGEIQVHFNALSYLDYHFDLMTGTTAYPDLYNINMRPTMTNASGAKTITLTGLNTLNEYQCLRIRANDACTPGNFVNDEICSIRSFNVQAQNLQNELTWTAYPNATNFSSFELRRGANLLANNANSPYIDNNVVCATDYCYRVKTLLSTTSSGGNQYSLSATKCVTAISTAIPTAVTNVNSTVNNSDIQVVFDAPTGFVVKTYQIFDATSGNEVANGTSTNVSFAASPGSCYKVRYQDQCNNTSVESGNTCTVSLTADLAEDGSIALAWTPYTGYTATGISSYDVLLVDENNQIIKTIPGGAGFTASDIPDASAGKLFYVVRVNSGGTENLISYSNKVELSLSPVVYIPDAFTPNGDGTNDLFELKTRFVKSIEITIYNRWGDPVFNSTDLSKSWDGKINGGDAPVGTYAYTLKIEGNRGESSTERGTISLIR